MDTITSTVTIQKPSESTDGYDGGLKLIRNTQGKSGGNRGNVNCVNYTYTIAGKDVQSFEWNSLAVLDNYADTGENCGSYIQANKHGSGPTWGLCVEACDTTPGDSTGLVTLELDQWVTGPDNGGRFALDIVVGDSKTKRNEPTGGIVEATAGIRIGNSDDAPHAKWINGIKLVGNIDTGINVSESSTKIALKLNKDQSIMFGDTLFNGKTNPLIYLAIGISVVSVALHFIK